MTDRAALERVRSLARSWASLRGDDVASETDRHLGLLLLGMLDGADGAPGGPRTRLEAVEALAEAWERPGGSLYYPAAGQAVLDALKGGAECDQSWLRSAATWIPDMTEEESRD